MSIRTSWIAPLVLLVSVEVWAASSVWRIEGGDSELYLGGTVHVLSHKDLPLPDEFYAAYRSTDLLVLETNVEALTQPALRQRFTESLSYDDGQTLRDVLSEETYLQLQAYLADKGLPIESFNHLRPSGVAITVLMLELQRAGVDQAGVDTIFFSEAKRGGKPVLALESPERHIAYIAEMGQGAEDQFVRQTLEEADNTGDALGAVIAAWRAGSRSDLVEAVIAGMPERYPQLYQSLLVERNARWLPQIADMLASPEKEFVLVGAAHLVGPDGLLNMLEASGFRIVQLD